MREGVLKITFPLFLLGQNRLNLIIINLYIKDKRYFKLKCGDPVSENFKLDPVPAYDRKGGIFMASRVLYPPILAPSLPAFVVYGESDDYLEIPFSLSEFNSLDSDFCVHLQIYRYDGVKVLDTSESSAATGILVNLEPDQIGDNSYVIEIPGSALSSRVSIDGKIYQGFIPGWTYKIQLRLSTSYYNYEEYPYPEAWLQQYSSTFSEWSTICYVKAIGPMEITLPCFEYNSLDEGWREMRWTSTLTDLDLTGSIESALPSVGEDFEYVRFLIYKDNDLIEDSGEIFKSNQSKSYFTYRPKTKFIETDTYQLWMTYKTENGYVPNRYLKINFQIINSAGEWIDATLVTVDNDSTGILKDLTFLDEEEDEGRIALKIKAPEDEPWSGNICIRRASQDDNFQTWEDITIFAVKEQLLNDLDLIYDYTIESGKWYKYAIQSISSSGVRGALVEMAQPIHRLFNYSFLLGQNNQQLKLQFDNTISNFKHQLYDTKTDTIGSKYPFFARDAIVNYKTFNVSALISFNMDENNTFLKNGKKDIYKYNDIVNLYEDYALSTGRYQYDYTYERDFRAKVLDFLQDGKPKLFKSPSEGNIILRLSDISCSPDKTTDRLIYSLSFNANEIDDNIMSNYLKYGFYNPGTYSTDLSVTTKHIGQIEGFFTPSNDIISLIREKYSNYSKDSKEYIREVSSIEKVKITFNGYYIFGEYPGDDPIYVEGKPLRILVGSGRTNLNEILGYGISFSSSTEYANIGVIYPNFVYTFDDAIKFGGAMRPMGPIDLAEELDSSSDHSTYMRRLYLSTGEDSNVIAVNATIDFYYNLTTYPVEEHSSVVGRTYITPGIGQIYETLTPGQSVYNLIYYKYHIQNSGKTRVLNSISKIEIESDPYTVFAIRDSGYEEKQYQVDATGILRLENFNNVVEIKYIGKRYLMNPYDESSLSEEILTEDDIEKGIKVKADSSILYQYTLTLTTAEKIFPGIPAIPDIPSPGGVIVKPIDPGSSTPTVPEGRVIKKVVLEEGD